MLVTSTLNTLCPLRWLLPWWKGFFSSLRISAKRWWSSLKENDLISNGRMPAYIESWPRPLQRALPGFHRIVQLCCAPIGLFLSAGRPYFVQFSPLRQVKKVWVNRIDRKHKYSKSTQYIMIRDKCVFFKEPLFNYISACKQINKHNELKLATIYRLIKLQHLLKWYV